MSGPPAADDPSSTPIGLRIAAILFGCFAVFIGAIPVATLLGFLPGAEALAPSSQVLVWITGVLFICAGLGVLLFGFGMTSLAVRLAAIALVTFALAFNWIAFGPGERHFTRAATVSAGAAATTRSAASESEGRVVFGIFALILDGLLLLAVIKVIRRDS